MRAAFRPIVGLAFILACQGTQASQPTTPRVAPPANGAQDATVATVATVATPPNAPEVPTAVVPKPIVQPEKEQVVMGGNLLRDPVGVLITALYAENDDDHFGGPLYIEGELMLDAKSAGAPLPQSFDREGKQVAGAMPLYRDGVWYFSRGVRLYRRELATSAKPQRDTLIATFPGNIVEMIWRADELFVLHDRLLEDEDASGGQNVGIVEMMVEHDPDGSADDLLVAPAHDISRVSALPQKPPATPERLVKERRQIRSWGVGGSKDARLVYYLDLDEGEEGSGLPEEIPASIRVLAPGAKIPREVVPFPPTAPISLIDGVAVTDRYVFWFDSDGEQASLWRKPHQGGGAATLLVGGKDLCWACIPRLHAGYVYWDSVDYVMRMAQRGGPIERLPMPGDDLAKAVKSDRGAWSVWAPGAGK